MSIRKLMPLFVVLALFAAACAAPEDEPAAPAPADPTDEETTPPADPGDDDTPPPDVAEGPYEHLARAEAGEFSGTSVTILGQWIDAEGENFANTLSGFADRTGIDIQYDGITNYETVLNVRVQGGDAPDLAQIAQPSSMAVFARDGHLVDISEWINTSQLQEDYGAWYDMTDVDGGIYGVFFKADAKSIVWYPVEAFEAEGYEIPTTWDELIALSDQIVGDGTAPWCISIEHGDASGWVATDWVEDILLRTAPPETYDAWVNHEIAFNDEAVLNAAEHMAQIWFTPDYAYGGNTYINSTFVGNTQDPMFDAAGPQCWMHKQAAWIPEFWPEGTEPGVDARFFYFPPIDEEFGSPVLGSGDMIMMFNDRDEVRAVLEYIATAEAAEGWAKAGGFIAANSTVPTDWYDTYSAQEISAILADADVVRFDASDLMPADVGAGTFWSGMVQWVAANGDGTEGIFQQIEDSWPAE